jgi:hypothetical protein
VLRPEVGAGAEVPTPDRAVAEQATTLLDKVVALTPGMADAHALLGYGRLVCGQPVPSAAALAKAYAISPRSEYALMAAQAYIAARDFKAARKTLGPLVARGDSPEIRQSARDMLGYLVSIEHPAPGSPPVPPATGAPGGPPATAEANVIPIYREVRPGETREKGTLTEIACGRNGIVLTVAGSTREVRLGVARFEDVAFISYRTDLTGGISCGRRASPERVYATWRDGGPAGTDGLAVAIEFLPLTDR